jgi:hypothetical protein
MNLLSIAIVASFCAAMEPITVASPGLTVVQLDPALAAAYSTSLAQQLTFRGVQVITGSDIASVMGYERQQQLVGCGDDGCKAKLALNLGVDALLAGQVSRLGKTYRLDVRLLEPGTARVLAAASASAEDSDRLVANFPVVAEQLALQVAARLGRALVPPADAKVITRWSTAKKMAFVPLALGAASAAAGATGLVLARGQYETLTQASLANPLSPSAADQSVAAGKAQQTWGLVGVAAGTGLLAVAAGLFLFGGDETVSVGLALGPTGATVGVAGAFP